MNSWNLVIPAIKSPNKGFGLLDHLFGKTNTPDELVAIIFSFIGKTRVFFHPDEDIHYYIEKLCFMNNFRVFNLNQSYCLYIGNIIQKCVDSYDNLIDYFIELGYLKEFIVKNESEFTYDPIISYSNSYLQKRGEFEEIVLPPSKEEEFRLKEEESRRLWNLNEQIEDYLVQKNEENEYLELQWDLHELKTSRFF